MPQRLTFDDLILYQAVFEVRYDDAFLIWDRSGAIWAELISTRPELKASHAESNKIVFVRSGDRELQLALEIRRLAVVSINPDKKLSEFSELVTRFTDIAARVLQIPVYSRVGLRISFVKEYANREAAAAALLESGILRLRDAPQFGLSSAIVDPEVSIRREDGKNGFSLRLKAESLTTEFEPSFGLGGLVKSQKIVKHRVHLDVDCYIQAPVELGKLYVSEWIDQTFHIIKRDSRKFFGE